MIETPWQHEPKSDGLDSVYQTDNGDFPVFLGGSGIPSKKTKPTLQETWKNMENIQHSGLTKNIGVMNFDQDLIEQILSISTIKPVTNQVESHFLLRQNNLLKYLRYARRTVPVFFGPKFLGHQIIFFLDITCPCQKLIKIQ